MDSSESVPEIVRKMPSFEAAWAKMEAEGYIYGSDALAQVRFGWEMALKELILISLQSR